jgi:hypothetical protein
VGVRIFLFGFIISGKDTLALTVNGDGLNEGSSVCVCSRKAKKSKKKAAFNLLMIRRSVCGGPDFPFLFFRLVITSRKIGTWNFVSLCLINYYPIMLLPSF